MSVVEGRFRRQCYACYDFEPTGDARCVECGLPHGQRLPEDQRPAAPDPLWMLRAIIGYA